MIHAPLLVTALLIGVTPIVPIQDAASTRLTLEQAMADPAWLGAFPERPRWTADGRLVFNRRVGETDERETLEVDPETGEARVISIEERVSLVDDGVWNAEHTRMASARDGDLVIMDADGTLVQVTTTTTREQPSHWLTDGRLAFLRDGTLMIRDLDTGIEIEPVELRFADPPGVPKDPEGLAADQRRLFDVLRERAERSEAGRLRREAEREATTHDVVGPVHLSPKDRETGRHLSPDGRWLLVEVASKSRPDARRDDMAIWVTDDGYVTSRGLRPKVGTQDRTAERLLLVDLASAEAHELDLDDLPERRVDRMASIRLENEAWLAALAAESPVKEVDHGGPRRAAEGDSEENHGDTEDTEGVGGETDGGSIGDRLTTLAQEAAKADDATEPSEPPLVDPRPASIMQVDWRPDGSLAAVMLRSLDNKDRWIAAIDPVGVVASTAAAEPEPADEVVGDDDLESSSHSSSRPDAPDVSVALRGEPIQTVHHLHDPAWINWSFNEMDWTRDGSRLWFLSEGDGWSDLLAWSPASTEESAAGDEADSPVAIAPLVTGAFEVRDVVEHPTDGTLFYRSNRDDPSVWRLERLDPTTGWSETLAGGAGQIERYTLSPDGASIAYLESTLDRPAELFVVDAAQDRDEDPEPRRLTDSASGAFTALDWRPSTLVDVPGRHGRDIRGRLYLPPADAPTLADGRRPAVLFVHGAGYLQNGHAGWSQYFREGFFNDLLAREGFVVLDLDYRASSGYGRDWRTAIARDMGPCELDDYEDGVAWLVEHHEVDPGRVGMYGGSYGGFTTLMGLLTRPGVFKAGAALRPVTDWAFYNDGYTANILNTPEVDPLAYRRSSPIEHAAGLEDDLLICHGMVDDNVPFSDTVRLAQRFIELGKSGWEVAIYPVEPHGFRETSSWIDEYRRIHELFTRSLSGP